MAFWETETAVARWHRHGPVAGFDIAPRSAGYMRDTSSLVWERLAAMHSPFSGMHAVATGPGTRGGAGGRSAAASGASPSPSVPFRPPVPAQPQFQMR